MSSDYARRFAPIRCEPRLTMAEPGRRIGMSSPAVTERVRRLEETGVIRCYRLDLNPAALGLPIAAYIRIRPNSGQLSRIAELAQQIPEVVECHRITGEDCFLVKAYIPAIDQLGRLLDSLLVYGSTTISLIQSSPVPLRSSPFPEETLFEETSNECDSRKKVLLRPGFLKRTLSAS